MGPLLCGLVLLQCTRAARAHVVRTLGQEAADSITNCWFIDDGAIFGPEATVYAFLDGFDSVHTKPLPFAAFVSVPTLAVWALAFLNAKPATRKADAAGGVPEASENDMNAML